MQGSLNRVRRVMAGEKPDRVPLFDLFCNDAVLRHFNGGQDVAPGDDAAAARKEIGHWQQRLQSPPDVREAAITYRL